MSLILECPHCSDCYSVEDWNANVAESMLVGRAEELIPDNMEDSSEWEVYALEKGGLVDCPSCGEVCDFVDMNVV